MTHVWLEYPETGGKAAFPAEAADVWRARGWADTDPPPEPDLLHDPASDDDGGVLSFAATEVADDTDTTEDVAEEIGEQGQDETPTRSGRRRRGAGTEE